MMKTSPSPVPSRDNPRNWPEDFAHENGEYFCTCGSCGNTFIGHKRRGTCKICASASKSVLPRATMTTELTAFLADRLQINTSSPEEMGGISQIANTCLEYFSSNVRGASASYGQVLLWAIFSALWEGTAKSEEIEEFFKNVRVDPAILFKVWREFSPEERAGVFTVALIPGRLDDADIASVAAALYSQRSQSGESPTTPNQQP